MAAYELDRADLWCLKGEGNANWVFAYAGSLPHLVRIAINAQLRCAPEVSPPKGGCRTAATHSHPAPPPPLPCTSHAACRLARCCECVNRSRTARQSRQPWKMMCGAPCWDA
jgi:hypothetical protein